MRETAFLPSGLPNCSSWLPGFQIHSLGADRQAMRLLFNPSSFSEWISLKAGASFGFNASSFETGLTKLTRLQDFAEKLSNTSQRNPVHPVNLDNPVFEYTAPSWVELIEPLDPAAKQ
jgi:hypothetical protein